MTSKLFNFLYNDVNKCFVSVNNSNEATMYSAIYDIEKDDSIFVELKCCYSRIFPKTVYVQYELYLNNILLDVATRSLIDKNEKITNEARQLEALSKAYSNKIITQELEAQKNHMLKTIYCANTLTKQ